MLTMLSPGVRPVTLYMLGTAPGAEKTDSVFPSDPRPTKDCARPDGGAQKRPTAARAKSACFFMMSLMVATAVFPEPQEQSHRPGNKTTVSVALYLLTKKVSASCAFGQVECAR